MRVTQGADGGRPVSGNTEPYIILIADTGNRYKGPLLDILETHLDKRWRVESVDLSRHDAEVRAQALREAVASLRAKFGPTNRAADYLARTEQTKEDR